MLPKSHLDLFDQFGWTPVGTEDIAFQYQNGRMYIDFDNLPALDDPDWKLDFDLFLDGYAALGRGISIRGGMSAKSLEALLWGVKVEAELNGQLDSAPDYKGTIWEASFNDGLEAARNLGLGN